MPDGAVYVGRPTQWGNPFPAEGDFIEATTRALRYPVAEMWTRGMAVALYRQWLTGDPVIRGDGPELGIDVQMTEGTVGGALWVATKRAGMLPLPPKPELLALRGKDLACWCPLDQPCHADVLLELANR